MTRLSLFGQPFDFFLSGETLPVKFPTPLLLYFLELFIRPLKYPPLCIILTSNKYLITCQELNFPNAECPAIEFQSSLKNQLTT